MTSFSVNEQFTEISTGDPVYTNTWGATWNVNASMLDQALVGILTLDVSGSSNVVLTVTSGATSQSLNQRFVFTGTLTGNIVVLWPLNLNRFFSVINNTTGSFTLSCGANNGSGSAGGTTVTVAQGSSALLVSNGVNVVAQFNTLGTTLSVAGGGTGATTFTAHGILLGEGTSPIVSTAAMTAGQLLIGQSSADPTPTTVTGVVAIDHTGLTTFAVVAPTIISGTSHTVTDSDNNAQLWFTSSSPVTVTFANSISAGVSGFWSQKGSGLVTFVAASGATLTSYNSQFKSTGQYAAGGFACSANAGSAAEVTLFGNTST